jgi:hypothetical protein
MGGIKDSYGKAAQAVMRQVFNLTACCARNLRLGSSASQLLNCLREPNPHGGFDSARLLHQAQNGFTFVVELNVMAGQDLVTVLLRNKTQKDTVAFGITGAVFLFGTGRRVFEDSGVPGTRTGLHTEQRLTVAHWFLVSAMIEKFEFLLQGS